MGKKGELKDVVKAKEIWEEKEEVKLLEKGFESFWEEHAEMKGNLLCGRSLALSVPGEQPGGEILHEWRTDPRLARTKDAVEKS